jgi:hypothetical protein
MRSRTPWAFSQLSAFASAFLAFPVTSEDASDLVFPLATISANLSRLGFRGLGLLALRGGYCLRREMPLWIAGGFCADLLIESLDFVDIADKLMLKADASVKSRRKALLTEGLERYSLGRFRSFFPLIKNYEKVSCEF